MLLEQTAAEEDLSAPGLSMTAGSKSVFISVNQFHRWFYNSYKSLQFLVTSFQQVLTTENTEYMAENGAEKGIFR